VTLTPAVSRLSVAVMGFLKDIKTLKQQGEAMTPPEYRGISGGMRQMKDLASTGTQMIGDMQAQQEIAQRLMATGRQGTAIVTALRDTGMTVNDNPQVELDLDVTVEGMPVYPVTHRQVISRLAIAGFQPGATVPVRVDPMEPRTLIIA
jgi:hypothetical protein